MVLLATNTTEYMPNLQCLAFLIPSCIDFTLRGIQTNEKKKSKLFDAPKHSYKIRNVAICRVTADVSGRRFIVRLCASLRFDRISIRITKSIYRIALNTSFAGKYGEKIHLFGIIWTIFSCGARSLAHCSHCSFCVREKKNPSKCFVWPN